MEVIHYSKGRCRDVRCCSDEDRNQFIRDSAIFLVREKEEVIKRLRKEIRRLHDKVSGFRKEITKLKELKT